MRFVAALFVVGAIVIAGIFGVWSLQAHAADTPQVVSMSALVFMAGLAGLGALLVKQPNR